MVRAVAIVLLCLALPAAGARAADDAPAAKQEPLLVIFFHAPGCSKCTEAARGIDEAETKWGPRIRVVRPRIDEAVPHAAWTEYREHYHVGTDAPPAVFVGDRSLETVKQILGGLDRAIAEELAAGHATYVSPSFAGELGPAPAEGAAPAGEGAAGARRRAAEEKVARWLEETGPWAIVAAGLVDGINPCAFTTIVFLISALAYLGRSRSQLAAAGTGFTLGVFVTYVLIGAALLTAIREFAVAEGVSRGLSISVAALAFTLAAWSLVDALRTWKSGDASKATLGMPKSVRARVNRVIRSHLTSTNVFLGALGAGVLVALLESVCTGQVYLPAIMVLARSETMRSQAVAYLLLYNLMFILPLVGVLAVAWCGVRSDTLAAFVRRHVPLTKVALALLFISLGVLILATL